MFQVENEILQDHVEAGRKRDHDMKALNYYKALAIGAVSPTHVPKRVVLPQDVEGISRTAEAGEYEVETDVRGLPLLCLPGGGRLKVKAADFEVLEWVFNPHLQK